MLLLLVLHSCHNENVSSNNIFHYNQSSGISTLDPAFSKDQSIIWACNQLYNGLVQLDDSLNIKPSIATSWEITDSGKIYTFHLRNDVSFHTNKCFPAGTRTVNAFDFVYALHRIIDPKTASPGAWIFNGKVDSMQPFTALDSFTFQIKLRQPFLPLMGILTMPYCSVVPKEAVVFYGLDFRANPVGTGPFQLKKWKEGVALIMTKNEHYFEMLGNERMPFMDGIRVSFIADKKSEIMAFQRKQLDFMTDLDASNIKTMLDEKGALREVYTRQFVLSKTPNLNTEYLGINLSDSNAANPLSNPKIRQAINCGIDRREILRYLRNGIGKPAENGFVPYGLPSFDGNNKVYTYNSEKASKLIQEAGYNANHPMPKITLYTNETYREVGLMVAKQLSKIGMEVKLEINPSSILREWMVKGKANFFRGSWIADYPDAESYYAVFYGKNTAPPNYTRFRNAEFDRIYEAALAESDISKRYELYHQLDRIIEVASPVVPLYYDEVLRFHHFHVKGLTPNALNLLNLKTVRLQ
ncbi:MAG: ABC transporter substrate-binding protein [Chitinophagales bacterium]